MKREINEELVDVWATMISEKMEQLQKQQNEILSKTGFIHDDKLEKELDNYRLLEAKISAYANALALFSSLEDGKFREDYERIVKPNNDWIPIDGNGIKPTENQLVYVSVDYSKGLNCRGLSMTSSEVIEARYINGTFLRESTGTCVDFIAKAWQPRYVPEPYHNQEES